MLGRFISADPLVPDPGNPQSLNRYGYVLNNPIRYNDPTGHAYECGVYAGTSCADVGPKFPVEIIQAPPDALDNVWAVTEFVGAVVSEPADWVLTARDFLSGQGSPWALVGLLPLVPSSVGKYADEAADALRAAGRIEEAVEVAGRSSRSPIVIGENMERVRRYARQISGETIDDWLAGRAWTQELNDEFIAWVKREGREVIDIGPDFNRRLRYRLDPADPLGRPPSSVYGSERRQLLGYEKYRRVYNRFWKYGGGVPGLDY